MELSRYLDRPGAKAELAELIGVTRGRVTQLSKPGEDWPADLALKAEKVTGGALNAADLSSIIARARIAA